MKTLSITLLLPAAGCVESCLKRNQIIMSMTGWFTGIHCFLKVRHQPDLFPFSWVIQQWINWVENHFSNCCIGTYSSLPPNFGLVSVSGWPFPMAFSFSPLVYSSIMAANYNYPIEVSCFLSQWILKCFLGFFLFGWLVGLIWFGFWVFFFWFLFQQEFWLFC